MECREKMRFAANLVKLRRQKNNSSLGYISTKRVFYKIIIIKVVLQWQDKCIAKEQNISN